MIMRTHGVQLVDELVHANLDAETAFTVCAYATRSDRLGAILLARAVLCGEAACSLSAMLGTPECNRGSEVVLRPGSPDWMALHDAMLTQDDAAVRDECVRIEDGILRRARDLLEYDLPADLQRLVEKFFAALLEHYGSLRALDLPAPEEAPPHPSLRVVRQATITGHA